MSESSTFSFERQPVRAANRSEALRQAAERLMPESPASAFAILKSLYADLMPCASRRGPRPVTSVAEQIAAGAGVEVTTIAAANAVALRQPIDPAVTDRVRRVGEVLMPVVRAVLAASVVIRSEAVAAQERLAGRICSSAERDNFRTRITSRLGDEAAEALSVDIRLLADEAALERVIVAAARAGLADASNARWSESWCDTRRRGNGEVREITVTEADDVAAWETYAHLARPRMLAFARSLVRHDVFAADDLVQEALLKTLQHGGAGDAETFLRYAMTQVRQVHADASAQVRTDILVDWDDRAGDGTGHTPEERTFGSAERSFSAEAEMTDGRLDATAAIERMSKGSGSSLHDVVRHELSTITARLRAGDIRADALTDRPALIAHLTAVVGAAGARSAAAARVVVLETFARIEREER